MLAEAVIVPPEHQLAPRACLRRLINHADARANPSHNSIGDTLGGARRGCWLRKAHRSLRPTDTKGSWTAQAECGSFAGVTFGQRRDAKGIDATRLLRS